MKILHIGLLSHYTEGMMYQDNILSEINVKDGHEVLYVTDTYRYKDGKLVATSEEDTILKNGVRLIRLKYDKIVNSFISRKIQKCHKLKSILNDFRPDSILFHGVCGYELLDVSEYVKRNPHVKFYIDSHEDFDNTAKTKISKFAYKYIHGVFVHKALKYANKILYLSTNGKNYLKTMYHIKDDMLEFYPLGGIVTSIEEQEKDRIKLIERLGVPFDSIICSHSGKLDKLKRTKELLQAFNKVTNRKIILLIFGAIPEENKKELENLMKLDDRVYFLGWKQNNEITELLNASDLYIQPGSQSATSQVAMCCGCAEIVAPTGYEDIYGDNVIYAESVEEIEDAIMKITINRQVLDDYKRKAYELACNVLDYNKLANRYLR